MANSNTRRPAILPPPSAKLAYLLAECRTCAAALYSKTPPTEPYARRAGDFLFSVGAHESEGFRFSRQIGFQFKNYRGGHGYWQMEISALVDAMTRLDRDPPLRLRAAQWYFDTLDPDDKWYLKVSSNWMLHEICANPRAAVLFARVYLLRFPEAIPIGLQRQAAYWGTHYNRRPNPEKLLDYRRDHLRYAAPAIAALDGTAA